MLDELDLRNILLETTGVMVLGNRRVRGHQDRREVAWAREVLHSDLHARLFLAFLLDTLRVTLAHPYDTSDSVFYEEYLTD